jgi:GrpB-like predicted nucleotidyltransferase (UPF0157 family)
VDLYEVGEISEAVEEVVACVRSQLNEWFPGLSVEHVGATALPDGQTKGDVDVALRPGAEDFEHVVDVLTAHFEVAQPENWTPTFASFHSSDYELPLGIQVSVLGSDADFLVALRDRMIQDARVRAAYNRCKEEAARGNSAEYWHAKDQFLQPLVDEIHRQRRTSGPE